MKRYTIPLQENGRMILPVELRRALEVDKGDRVVLQTDGDSIELTTARRNRRRAQEIFRRYVPAGQNLVDQFIEEKREEARRDGDFEPEARSRTLPSSPKSAIG